MTPHQRHNLLCTDLSIWPTFGDRAVVSDAIHGHTPLKENLINRLLLYDQIFIPSGNLLIIAVLRLWLGDNAFRRLLEEEIIVLVRYDTWFCYVGNGGGLKFYKILPGDEPKTREHNLATLYYAPLDEAVSQTLRLTKPQTSDEQRKELERLLLSKVRPVSLGQYEQKLRHETYTDILKSPILSSFFAIRNTNLDHLHGIGPNQVRLTDFHRPDPPENPEITAVLHIALENLLLALALDTANTIQADMNAQMVLKAKAQRLGLGQPELDGFLSVEDFAGIPNVGKGYVAGELSFDTIMQLRESRAAKEFRAWLSSIDPLSKEDVLRAYVKSLGEKPLIEKLPAKLLRFATTAILGKIPIVGDIASFADSFLLEKWFPGRGPKLLLDEIRRVVVKEQTKHIKGTQRNEPCPCGSGKKYKKCHGR